MPLYEYKCRKCGRRFEKIEGLSATMTKKCPQCGGKAERQIAVSAIQFKGSGWYVTDYAKKSSGAPAGEKSGDGAPSAPEKAAESKPASSDKTEKAPAKKKK